MSDDLRVVLLYIGAIFSCGSATVMFILGIRMILLASGMKL